MSPDEQVVDTSHSHVAEGGKVTLTLAQLAEIQPGLAAVMLEISNRFARCYHAARAQNRRLARFQLSEGTKLLRKCALLRPKYADDLASFIDKDLGGLREAIEAADWSAFEEAFVSMTDSVNQLHEVWNHGYIVWQVPATPPDDLVLAPRPEDR